MTKIRLSQMIMEQRRKKGISQEELARYIGVSKAAVSKWENEQSFPDILLLPELATYFDITIDELIGYEPQLTKEEIRKQYRYYANKFDGASGNEFDTVFQECNDMIKKYYSCYPFLYQMAVLLLNQAVNAPDRQQVLEYAVALLIRVRQESEDPNLQKDAISAQVTCHLMQGEPQKAQELLGEDVRPMPQDIELLAQTYQQQGNIEKADEILQISVYQHVLLAIGDSVSWLLLQMTDFPKAKEIMKRNDEMIQIFQVDKLHPNVALSYNLTCAQIYCVNQENDKAIQALEKYVRVCTESLFPYKLHGDAYFDKIGDWFEQFDLGTDAPRGERAIKQSLIQSMCANPLLEGLYDHPRFRQLKKCLYHKLGQTEGEK